MMNILKPLRLRRPTSDYKIMKHISSGGYGSVYVGRHKKTGKMVAIKELELPFGTRVRGGEYVYLFRFAMDLCDFDLNKVVLSKAQLTDYLKQDIARQLLNGLCYLHQFIDPLTLGNRKCLTPGLGTRRYSPPDVLLRSPTYGKSVDLWAIGCILIELWTKEFFICPLQLGFENEISATLREITNIFGPINNKTLPGIERLFMYDTYRSKINSFGERSFRKLYESKVTSPEAFDLIDRLLVYDPSKRLTAKEAIEHEYFKCRIPPSGESEIKIHKKFWCM
ncbi:hypothetical protein ACTXT7_016564 [Hymenolepis weldensis]